MTDDTSLTSRLDKWLGKDGRTFFADVKRTRGTVLAVIPGPVINGRSIPHAVHFREGMQVRNWLRSQPECKDWTDQDFDNKWVGLVEEVLTRYSKR